MYSMPKAAKIAHINARPQVSLMWITMATVEAPSWSPVRPGSTRWGRLARGRAISGQVPRLRRKHRDGRRVSRRVQRAVEDQCRQGVVDAVSWVATARFAGAVSVAISLLRRGAAIPACSGSIAAPAHNPEPFVRALAQLRLSLRPLREDAVKHDCAWVWRSGGGTRVEDVAELQFTFPAFTEGVSQAARRRSISSASVRCPNSGAA